MDSRVEVYLKRGRSEIDSAVILFESSGRKEVLELFNIDEASTFYSGVISHAYYSIFYCAKAMLESKKISTESPDVHKKTFVQFKEVFVDSGMLDIELLRIYKEMIIRADELLHIFKEEKWKRGHFTYQTIPQANVQPAKESIENAKKFYKHINKYLEER